MAEPLVMWTVYNRPTDYPEHCVARRWEIGEGEATPTWLVIVAPDLATLRAHLGNMGLYCLPRHESDEPQIVETWL